MASITAKWKKRFWVTILLLLFLLRLASYFQDFMDSDEGIYGAVALAITGGDQPYRDAIERKTPLAYYTYAGIFELFGDGNMLAVHLFMTLWVGCTALVLFRLMQLLVRNTKGYEKAPYAAAALYVIFSAGFHFEWLAANCEMLLDLPLALGFLLAFGSVQSPWVVRSLPKRLLYSFAAGAMLGTAFLYKQTALIACCAALVFVLVFVFIEARRLMAYALLQAIVTVCGFVTMLWLSYVYFSLQGVEHDYLYWAWTVNFQYINDSFNISYVLQKFLLHTGLFLLIMLPAMLLLVRYLRKPRMLGWYSMLPLAWLLAQFCALWVSGKFYIHYYYHLVAPLSLAGGFAFVGMKAKTQKRFAYVIVSMACVLAMVWFFRTPLMGLGAKGYAEPNYRAIATYIKANSSPEDKIFVWGYSPEIYVLSQRRSASRFVFCDYLTGRISGHPRVLDPDFDTSMYAAPGAWLMLHMDLVGKRPLYFIDATPGNFHQYGKYKISRYPWLTKFVDDNYIFQREIAGAHIYRLKRISENPPI